MSKSQILNLELSDRPELEVSLPVERITLEALEPGGAPRIEFELRRASDEVPFELTREGDVVRLRSPARSGVMGWPGASVIKRMTIHVPPHVRARVVQEFGQLFVSRLAGCDLDVSCNAGEVVLSQVRGRMKIVVDAGTVKGEGLSGTFDVMSQAGAVKLAIDALDAGTHSVRTAMGSVKLELAPEVKVQVETHTSLGSARVLHPTTPGAPATLSLSADLGSIKVKTGRSVEDVRHGDWPDWRRVWRDVAQTVSEAIEDTLPPVRPTVAPPPARPVPEAELRKVLELVESGKLSAPDAERLIRAMGA